MKRLRASSVETHFFLSGQVHPTPALNAIAEGGRRSIWGGHAQVRLVSSGGTLDAIRLNPVISAFNARFVAAGKIRMVAVVACMCKLLAAVSALLRSGPPWYTEISF
jgi:transposase